MSSNEEVLVSNDMQNEPLINDLLLHIQKTTTARNMVSDKIKHLYIGPNRQVSYNVKSNVIIPSSRNHRLLTLFLIIVPSLYVFVVEIGLNKNFYRDGIFPDNLISFLGGQQNYKIIV